MATSRQPSGRSRMSKGKLAAGVFGVLALFGVAGTIGSHSTDTNPASDTRAAATSTSAPHSAESLRSTYTAPSTSRTTTPPPPPAPTMAMTCPAGGTVASPVFGNQIIAIAPFTVNAVVTDATGQTGAATCTYSWTAPPPPPAPVVRSSGSSGGSSSGSAGGDSSSAPVDTSGSSSGTVHPGAFCSTVGATGYTSTGTLTVCSTKPGDDRARWRSA